MNLPKSLGALLHNLSIVLLDRSKALKAAQKRDYNDEDELVHTGIRNYLMTRVCTARKC